MTPTTPSDIQGNERYPAESIIQHYALRAKGGAALITVTGAPAFLSEEAKPETLRNDFEFDIEAANQHYLSQLTENIHMFGS